MLQDEFALRLALGRSIVPTRPSWRWINFDVTLMDSLVDITNFWRMYFTAIIARRITAGIYLSSTSEASIETQNFVIQFDSSFRLKRSSASFHVCSCISCFVVFAKRTKRIRFPCLSSLAKERFTVFDKFILVARSHCSFDSQNVRIFPSRQCRVPRLRSISHWLKWNKMKLCFPAFLCNITHIECSITSCNFVKTLRGREVDRYFPTSLLFRQIHPLNYTNFRF